ncbi:MAG: chemotaxis protein CheW, partial [Rhodospirillales bacterium]|nr:chemotaxis protein CheW [Rhodospirillales bacterium]
DKAIENGIVEADALLRSEDIDDLIFAPGFSTAEKVTDVSGRGVGMDVVRRSINDLGGRVSVTSIPGKGARFLLSLPLTLAVLDGMIIKVGPEKYILPLACIIDSLQPSKEEIKSVMHQAQVIKHRGNYVPVISLASLFNKGENVSDPSDGLIVFVETGFGNTLGLIIDDIIGQNQIVIKSLEENYLKIEGVSAATILGDGRVALILDVDGIENMLISKKAISSFPANPLLLESETRL